MNKLVVTALMALALSAGAASAQQTGYINLTPRPHAGTPLKQRLAMLKQDNAFGVNTTSAFTRNVGPSSSVTANPANYLGTAASGMPNSPRAPSAGNASGGN